MLHRPEHEQLEIEIKLELPSFTDYLKLLGYVGAIEREISQENAFFDTPDRLLSHNGWALRVRATALGGLVTLKGLTTVSGAAAMRQEIEEEIEQQTALDLIHLRREPLDFASRPITYITQTYHPSSLVRLIMFRNTRQYKQLELDGLPYQFEIDKTEYLDGSVDYELEVELADVIDVPIAEKSLHSLFNRLGIPFLPQRESKFGRALAKAGLS